MTHSGWVDGFIRDCRVPGQEKFFGLLVLQVKGYESLRRRFGSAEAEKVMATLSNRIRFELGSSARRCEADRLAIALTGVEPSSQKSKVDSIISLLNETPYVVDGEVVYLPLVTGFASWNGRQTGRELLDFAHFSVSISAQRAA